MVFSVAGVSAIAFHPMKDMAVSSSQGGDFKVKLPCSYSCSLSFSVSPHTCTDLELLYVNSVLFLVQIWIHGPANVKSGWRCQSVGSYK